MFRKTMLSLLFLFVFSISAFSQAVLDTMLHKIQEKLESIYDTIDYAGAIFSVVLPDGSYGAVPIGYSDQEKEIPMEKEDLMLGGSTGKVFVSAVIMQLVEDGVLDLDRPVSEYLGKYEWYEKIQNAELLTLRNLMRHSSGISRYVFQEQFLQDVTEQTDRVWRPEELLSYVFGQQPLFKPGEDFAYSDTNYILAAMILEEVTGNTMYQLVQERVLNPFDLKRIRPQIDREIDGLAIGYNAPDDPFYPGVVVKEGVYQYNVQFEWSGGGFVMNSQDLARVGKLIYEGQVFDPNLLDDFFNGVDAGRMGGQWGLGVHITETPHGKAYGHSGFFPGYITNMLYFPEKRIAVAYQCNASGREHRTLFYAMRDVVKMVLEEF